MNTAILTRQETQPDISKGNRSHSLESYSTAKLSWLMCEESECWFVKYSGMTANYNENKGKWEGCAKVSFAHLVNGRQRLCEPQFHFLKAEIQASCVYLVQSAYTKAEYLDSYVRDICRLINFLNAHYSKSESKSHLLSFAQITHSDMQAYLEFVTEDDEYIEIAEKLILGNPEKYFSGNKLNESRLISDLRISKLRYKMLKTQLLVLIKNKMQLLSTRDAEREFRSVLPSKLHRDREDSGKISESSLSRIQTHLNYLFVSNSVLKEPLAVNIKMDLSEFSSDNVLVKRVTPIVPLCTHSYIYSKVLWFQQYVAIELKKYVEEYLKVYKQKTSHLSKNTLNKNGKSYHVQTLTEVKMPAALKSIYVKQFQETQTNKRKNTNNAFYRNHLSVLDLVRLNAISVMMLIFINSALRDKAVRTLERDCLRMSILDGLWDIEYYRLKDGSNIDWVKSSKPIPKSVFDAVDNHIELIDKLEEYFDISISEQTDRQSLFPDFLKPSSKSSNPMTYDSVIKWFDIFSDWIEVPVAEDDKRWYVRPHQLRRTFAVLFFNTFKKSLSTTLSWMFDHENLEVTMAYAESNSSPEWQEEARRFLLELSKSNQEYLVELSDDLNELKQDIANKPSYEIDLISENYDTYINNFLSDKNIRWELMDGNKLFMYVEGE